MKSSGRTGELLLRLGLVDSAGLARAQEPQVPPPATLGRALAALGLADEGAVAAALASALHLDYLEGPLPAVPVEIAALLAAEFCRSHGVLPLGLDGKRLRVAVRDPMDDPTLQDIRFRVGRPVVAVVVTETRFEELYALVYPPDPTSRTLDALVQAAPAGEIEAAVGEELEIVDPATLEKDTRLPPIVKLVNLILSDAATAGASDVHVEAYESTVQVRRRVDGLLADVMTVPAALKDQVVSRLKIMSGMDISERRKPQDGRSRLRFEGRRIDLRVSTLPTQFGEKVVIRLLDSGRAVLPLDQIGFSPEHLASMRSFLARPQGMVLVTGPTGSGKTSTLYTALNAIKSETNNIVTLEDPIEVRMAGVNQMQINVRAGLTFASGLRSILRQDPNIILVGEIRDAETAETALQAAQTGHLLLSTLHTNDAPSTITRLFDLGSAPFLVASSLVGIVAQRLVRRVCPHCAVAQEPGADVVARIGASALRADGRWTVGRGCPQCGGSGVSGRLAIHEVLTVTEEVREMIAARASEHAIRAAARRSGLRTLFEDGIEKAAQGLTTIEEVLRVAPPPEARVETPQPEADQSPDLRGRRVLVVEDSPTIATVIKYFLENEGFEVLMAPDGRQGLDLALRERPDVIVSDINMPGLGGIDMTRALREDYGIRNVRILMLTSDESVEAETASLAAGADDHILKPVEPRRLAARVKALLGRRRTIAA